MLMLGESRDRGSKMKLDKAIEAAQRAGVAIYPITYSAQATAWTAMGPRTIRRSLSSQTMWAPSKNWPGWAPPTRPMR